VLIPYCIWSHSSRQILRCPQPELMHAWTCLIWDRRNFFKGPGAVDSSFICIKNTLLKCLLLSIRVANPVVLKCQKNDNLKTEAKLSLGYTSKTVCGPALVWTFSLFWSGELTPKTYWSTLDTICIFEPLSGWGPQIRTSY